MNKSNPALIQKRRDEIIEGAKRLYQSMPYCKITYRDVAEQLTVGRSSIYNYFHTMEEIFLGVLQKEYELWNQDILHILDEYETLDVDGYASALANTLASRETMLKLLAMNIYELENNSRKAYLVEFKKAFGSTIESISATLHRYFPKMDHTDHIHLIYLLYPYLMGVYNYTHVEPYQKEAMEQADVLYHAYTTEELVKSLIKRALAPFQ